MSDCCHCVFIRLSVYQCLSLLEQTSVISESMMMLMSLMLFITDTGEEGSLEVMNLLLCSININRMFVQSCQVFHNVLKT